MVVVVVVMCARVCEGGVGWVWASAGMNEWIVGVHVFCAERCW